MPMFRFFVPKLLTAEEIDKYRSTNKPVFTRIHLPYPRYYRFLGVHTVPTLTDALGLSQSSGPPGYGFWFEDDAGPMTPSLFCVVQPEKALSFKFSVESRVNPMGFVSTLGMMMGCIEITSPELSVVEQELRSVGAEIVDAQPYVIPPYLMQTALERRGTLTAQESILTDAINKM